MKTVTFLLLLASVLFTLAACATPEQTAAVVTGVAASAAELINALSPLIPPEKLAALQATAGHIDGTVQATATAVHTLAEAVSQINAAAGAKMATFADSVTQVTAALAERPTTGQVLEYSGGIGALATGASRALSVAKHGFVGKAPAAAS